MTDCTCNNFPSSLGMVTFGGDVRVGDQNLVDAGQGNQSLYISNNAGDQNNSFRLDAFANTLSIIGRSAGGATAGTNIAFRTSGASGGDWDRMIITALGNVGIGTMTPDAAAKLHVA